MPHSAPCCARRGTIPSSISLLSSLLSLDLGSNQLTGTLPAWLGDLPMLQQVDLSSNLLTGTIPPSACNGSARLTLFNNTDLKGAMKSKKVWSRKQHLGSIVCAQGRRVLCRC